MNRKIFYGMSGFLFILCLVIFSGCLNTPDNSVISLTITDSTPPKGSSLSNQAAFSIEFSYNDPFTNSYPNSINEYNVNAILIDSTGNRYYFDQVGIQYNYFTQSKRQPMDKLQSSPDGITAFFH